MRLRYRDEAELARWRRRDPLALQSRRVPDHERDRIDADVERALDEAVRFTLESPRPDPAGAFDHLYAHGVPIRPGVSGA
jgi:pyruvate dehydrogenase E1 component alpha subunit